MNKSIENHSSYLYLWKYEPFERIIIHNSANPTDAFYFLPIQDLIRRDPQPTSASSSFRMFSSACERFVISGMMSSRIFNSLRVNTKSRLFLIPIITTNINGNRIEVVLKDLMTHKTIRHVSWIMVNMWTRFSGT